MAECSAAGLSITEFWFSTYRELYAVLRGDRMRQRAARDLALFTAWHTEAFARTKRLPDLAALLRKGTEQRAMSPVELRSKIIQVAQAFGAKVIRRKKE